MKLMLRDIPAAPITKTTPDRHSVFALPPPRHTFGARAIHVDEIRAELLFCFCFRQKHLYTPSAFSMEFRLNEKLEWQDAEYFVYFDRPNGSAWAS